MKTYLKYLISLLLAFGLTANDCILNSTSIATAYYQFSYVKAIKDHRNSISYIFNQGKNVKKIVPPFVYKLLSLQAVFTLQTTVLFKLRTVLSEKNSLVQAQQTFLNQITTSSTIFSPLYIA